MTGKSLFWEDAASRIWEILLKTRTGSGSKNPTDVSICLLTAVLSTNTSPPELIS